MYPLEKFRGNSGNNSGENQYRIFQQLEMRDDFVKFAVKMIDVLVRLTVLSKECWRKR